MSDGDNPSSEQAESDEAVLAVVVTVIGNRGCWPRENAFAVREIDAVFTEVRVAFLFVPLEFHVRNANCSYNLWLRKAANAKEWGPWRKQRHGSYFAAPIEILFQELSSKGPLHFQKLEVTDGRKYHAPAPAGKPGRATYIGGTAVTYENFFKRATRSKSQPDGLEAFPYQRRLAEAAWPDLLDVPTGLGKTAGIVLAWLWKRGWRTSGQQIKPDADTPRRLIYCLPMRVLVEQTYANVHRWLKSLDCLGEPGQGKVSAHLLMGGSEGVVTATWVDHPEEDAILIGTQDMLLSRALMRGYGMSRYQWPVHFALLHNDALWIYDEVQLMGAGLTTSAQLEAFRRTFPSGKNGRSLWVSATLNKQWLSTVDFHPHLDNLVSLSLTETEKRNRQVRIRREAKKSITRAQTRSKSDDVKGRDVYAKGLAREVLQHHRPETNTVVILNTVDRAQAVFQAVQKLAPDLPALLVHARFRARERSLLNAALGEAAPEKGRIIVATQAIEAGVDISSRVLFTEAAPWTSVVQRFGRCNRYGEYNKQGAEVLWIDTSADEELARPYSLDEIKESTKRLRALESASPGDLPSVDQTAPEFPVLRRKDFLDLFNIDPDITGFDLDISSYIRDADDLDAQVFWRDLSGGVEGQPQPHREELCRASLSQFKRYLERVRKKNVAAWRWDALAARWVRYSGTVRPGLTLMLDAAAGGYDPILGFAPEVSTPVPTLNLATIGGEERYDGDWRSFQQHAVQLTRHLIDVEDEAAVLAKALGLPPEEAEALTLSARWHDVGKTHPAFQGMLRLADSALDSSAFFAKAGNSGERRSRPRYRFQAPDGTVQERRYFRHELASALAWMQQRTDHRSADLIAYLIAAHHGKVRTNLRALPDEPAPPELDRRYARGVWEWDVLPAFPISDRDQVSQLKLRLDVIELGDGAMGPSWIARVARLLKELGPFRLTWLESLVRIADWRASRKEQENPQ